MLRSIFSNTTHYIIFGARFANHIIHSFSTYSTVNEEVVQLPVIQEVEQPSPHPVCLCVLLIQDADFQFRGKQDGRRRVTSSHTPDCSSFLQENTATWRKQDFKLTAFPKASARVYECGDQRRESPYYSPPFYNLRLASLIGGVARSMYSHMRVMWELRCVTRCDPINCCSCIGLPSTSQCVKLRLYTMLGLCVVTHWCSTYSHIHDHLLHHSIWPNTGPVSTRSVIGSWVN
jgi:hypothetical protein